MAHYLVRAQLRPGLTAELWTRLVGEELRLLQPYGASLQASLLAARWDPTAKVAAWEEVCYCNPPLAAERAEVLDRFFSHLVTEPVAPLEGWKRIESLPKLWEALPDEM